MPSTSGYASTRSTSSASRKCCPVLGLIGSRLGCVVRSASPKDRGPCQHRPNHHFGQDQGGQQGQRHRGLSGGQSPSSLDVRESSSPTSGASPSLRGRILRGYAVRAALSNDGVGVPSTTLTTAPSRNGRTTSFGHEGVYPQTQHPISKDVTELWICTFWKATLKITL